MTRPKLPPGQPVRLGPSPEEEKTFNRLLTAVIVIAIAGGIGSCLSEQDTPQKVERQLNCICK